MLKRGEKSDTYLIHVFRLPQSITADEKSQCWLKAPVFYLFQLVEVFLSRKPSKVMLTINDHYISWMVIQLLLTASGQLAWLAHSRLLGCIYTSQTLFANVRKRSRTFVNMQEGLLFTLPEPHLRAFVLEHSTKFPTQHLGYQNLPFVLRRQ